MGLASRGGQATGVHGPPIDTPDLRDYPSSMDVCSGFDRFAPPPEGVVLTIGNFDGVHRGHARLIRTAHSVADCLSVPMAVITFHPHPLAILAPERAPERLTTLAERLALLEHLGVGCCIVLRSEAEFLAQRAEDFLASLVAHCRPRALVEGPDFNFGRGREGSLDTLRSHAQQWDYEVHTVPAVHCSELSTDPIIKSSSIRQALQEGRVREANAMLGRAYRITGRTGEGARRGTGLGFPTANLNDIVHLLPQQAVYAAVAQLDDETRYTAAVNIGPQPTFSQDVSRVEAHLLDFDGNLRGQRIGLHLLTRLRVQSRFHNSDELVTQLRQDVAATGDLAEDPDSSRIECIPL